VTDESLAVWHAEAEWAAAKLQDMEAACVATGSD
jgi:hypothetical protein